MGPVCLQARTWIGSISKKSAYYCWKVYSFILVFFSFQEIDNGKCIFVDLHPKKILTSLKFLLVCIWFCIFRSIVFRSVVTLNLLNTNWWYQKGNLIKEIFWLIIAECKWLKYCISFEINFCIFFVLHFEKKEVSINKHWWTLKLWW